MENHRKNLVLCGFMGCGKTTVGKRLSKMIGYEFLDMDQYIERQQGMTISKIFEQKGEPEFRRIECETVRELAKRQGLVIATGGGALINPDNAREFQKTGEIILLDTPLRALQERLKNCDDRPVLKQGDPDRAAFIAQLHAKRMPFYQSAANWVIDAGAPVKEVTRRIMQALSLTPKPEPQNSYSPHQG